MKNYLTEKDFILDELKTIKNKLVSNDGFKKQNVIIKETYIDENGYEQERERSVQMTKFPPKEEKVDLISKIDARLKDVNPNYEPPTQDNITKNTENHNVKELIDKIDEKIRRINESVANDIFQKISNLPNGTEFNFQQFMNNYDIEDQDKFVISDLICDYCKDNDITIVEKFLGTNLDLPWNISRIKK